MSFQLSQNLLADLQATQSQSPKASVSLLSTEPVIAASQHDPSNLSQVSQSLLENCSQSQLQLPPALQEQVFPPQSQSYFQNRFHQNTQAPPVSHIPQLYSIPQNSRSLLRSQSQQSQISAAAQQFPSSRTHSLSQSNLQPQQTRIPASRLSQTADSPNILLAKTLKQLKSRVDAIPILFSRSLEEGLEFLEKEINKESEETRLKTEEVKEKLEKIIKVSKDNESNINQAIEQCLGDVKVFAELLRTIKDDHKKYEDGIANLECIIVGTKKVIDDQKKSKSFSTGLRVKGDDQLLIDTKPKRSKIEQLPKVKLDGSPFPDMSSFLTPSNSRSGFVRHFSPDIIQDSEADITQSQSSLEDDLKADNPSSLDLNLDFSNIIEIDSDLSDYDQDMTVEE